MGRGHRHSLKCAITEEEPNLNQPTCTNSTTSTTSTVQGDNTKALPGKVGTTTEDTKALLGKVETVTLADLKAADYNPRQISNDNLESLKASIESLGYFDPIIINQDNTIISGHQRVKALISTGTAKQVQVLRVDVDKRTERLINLAANSKGLQGEWNKPALLRLLAETQLTDKELLATAIRKDKEVANALRRVSYNQNYNERKGERYNIREGDTWEESQPGGVYRIGRHIVVCGDSRDTKSYSHLPEGAIFTSMVTSPPYGVGLAYEGGKDAYKDLEANLELVRGVLKACKEKLADRAMVAWVVGSSGGLNLPAQHSLILEEEGFYFRNMIAWDKICRFGQQFGVFVQNPYPSYYYPNLSIEYILIYQWGSVGANPLAKLDRMLDVEVVKEYNRDIWQIPAPKIKIGHPAPYPFTLASRAVQLYTSKVGVRVGDETRGEQLEGWVLDPFGGSGTTAMAAEANDRPSYTIELDPKYCDLIRKRLGDFIQSGGELEEEELEVEDDGE